MIYTKMINTWKLETLKSRFSILYSPHELKSLDLWGLNDFNEKIIYGKVSPKSKKNIFLFQSKAQCN